MTESQASERTLASPEEVIERIREQLLKQGVGYFKAFGKIMKEYDVDGSDSISVEELPEVLKHYSIEMSPDDLEALFEEFDEDKSGQINQKEFMRVLRPPMSQARKDIVKKAFDQVNKDGNDAITEEDLKGAYSYQSHPKFQSGEWSKKRVFQEFLNTFQTDEQTRDDKVTFDEFLNYYSGLSATIKRDVEFDLEIRQAWQI